MKYLILAGTAALVRLLYAPTLAAVNAKKYKKKTQPNVDASVNKNNTEDHNNIEVSVKTDEASVVDTGAMSSSAIEPEVCGAANRKSARRVGAKNCSTDSPRKEQNQNRSRKKTRNRTIIQTQGRFIPPTVEPTLVNVEIEEIPIDDQPR